MKNLAGTACAPRGTKRSIESENDIHAQMNDGILTLQIPKTEETKRVEDKRHLVQITAA